MNPCVFVQVWVPPTHNLLKNRQGLCHDTIPNIFAEVFNSNSKGLEIDRTLVRVAIQEVGLEMSNLAGEMILIVSHNFPLGDQTRHAIETQVSAKLGGYLELISVYTRPTVFVQ